MSVGVRLACIAPGCTAAVVLRPTFTLTRWGYLRVEGDANGWMVDGSGALCPVHKPDVLPRPQLETWGDVDRQNVIADLESEGWTVEEPR